MKAKIPVAHGKNYEDHPILGVGPHNTWINSDGSRVYMAKICFHRTDGTVTLPFSTGGESLCESGDLDGIAQGCSCSMGL